MRTLDLHSNYVSMIWNTICLERENDIWLQVLKQFYSKGTNTIHVYTKVHMLQAKNR